MLKIRNFTAAALLILGIFIAPNLVQADSSYRIFTLTPDQLGQASSGDYRRCVTLAGVNTSSRLDCVIAEQSLVDRRIVSRDRAILAQMSGTDKIGRAHV